MKKSYVKYLSILLFVIGLIFTKKVYAQDNYTDDIYDGDYSLEEILKNYSVVTFGKKEVDEKVNENTRIEISKGDVKLFHISSQFLINGNLKSMGVRADFREGTEHLKSYVKNIGSSMYCEINYSNNCENSTLYSDIVFNYRTNYINNRKKSSIKGNYINFDRLYDSITKIQERIPKGKELSVGINNAHMIGGEDYQDGVGVFYLSEESINSCKNKWSNILNPECFLILQDLLKGKDNLTIITIDSPGEVTIPGMSSDNHFLPILTNDYYGMERPNDNYAAYYVQENYYGNLIWNIPNASLVILPSKANIGHIIAPNADVYAPAEMQFAGAIIANSVSFYGNSEVHFYPIQLTNIPYTTSTETYEAIPNVDEEKGDIEFDEGIDVQSLQEGMVIKFRARTFNGYTISNILIKDSNDNIIEVRKVSDDEYEFTMPSTNVTISPIFEVDNSIDVPDTLKNIDVKYILIVVALLMLLGIIYFYKKREKDKI